ncbi:FxsA family protein [Rhizobiaceae bacterium BDR2-2]|uniref:FxsA family protein n=1 Tax=Ectorhizobium quercum TaxID=2965071 RepID=A0AAE3SWS5_9HYPH|nr:FxsA family protein [Ectorhizobium quercum]MCX8999487.1 FxsA family protein [Ectorhizobium quercum]
MNPVTTTSFRKKYDETMPSRLLVPVLLLLPLAEIAVFVLVGQRIGVAATILTVLASTFAGLVLLRRQGVSMIRNLQAGTPGAAGGDEVMRSMLYMVAGLLLAVPGFITSALGLLLLLPFTRSFLWKSLKPDVIVTRSARFYRRPDPGGNAESRRGPSVIDLDEDEFRRDDDGGSASPSKPGESPWSRPDKPPGH